MTTTHVTIRNVLGKTLILFVILHAAALAGIYATVTPILHLGAEDTATAIPWLTGVVGVVVCGIALTRVRRRRILLISAFVATEGLFLGGLATYFEVVFPGILLQVAFALLSTVVALLVLLTIGPVRHLNDRAKIVLLVLGGYVVFTLHNLTLTSMDFLPETTAWGRGSAELFGAPLGLIAALLSTPLIAWALVRALSRIETRLAAGAPGPYAWEAGHHVMVTIITHGLPVASRHRRSSDSVSADL
ncbi:Bax inhibitor-1/YccA family membrane protein [Brachybacterium tyrofermentans]|uniref:Bax inhibitor-1/YccA family membrane protein n=1 Tax=Brachybacterium tyrofermentans TaxID=47848 RepID=UPI003FD15CEF